MATLQELKTSIQELHDSVADGFTSIQTKVDDLKAQIAAGSPVSQSDLDDLNAEVEAAKADLLSKESTVG